MKLIFEVMINPYRSEGPRIEPIQADLLFKPTIRLDRPVFGRCYFEDTIRWEHVAGGRLASHSAPEGAVVPRYHPLVASCVRSHFGEGVSGDVKHAMDVAFAAFFGPYKQA